MNRLNRFAVLALLLQACFGTEPAKFRDAECHANRPCPGGELCIDLKCVAQCLDSFTCDEGEACIANYCQPYDEPCSTSDVCEPAFWCEAGTCQKKHELGAACDDPLACQSGFCADYVCCDSGCYGGCEACSFFTNGQFDGACLPVLAGEDPRESCIGDAMCDGSGACDIRDIGAECAHPYECNTGKCVDGRCCNTDCDGTCMSCSAATSNGADGWCANVRSGLDAREDCPGATACDGLASCFDFAVGDGCESDFECASGYCVDGVCCDQACETPCYACSDDKTDASPGMCAPVSRGLDPTNACSGVAACNGAGGCFNTPEAQACAADFECASGFCREGVCCSTPCDGVCKRCNGTVPGTCSDMVSAQDVGTCSATVANGGCDEAPCACNGSGECAALTGSCASGADCASESCHNGVCCSTACEDPCYACNGSSTGVADGVCAPVQQGKDPFDDCAGVTACTGSGACYDKAQGATCQYNYECANDRCVDGRCCNTACTGLCSVCDGEGTQVANPGSCSLVASGQDPDNECAGGAACNGAGGCYNKGVGQACEFDFECESGSCCGGACNYGWKSVPSPVTVQLNSVWGRSATDVWAVGNGGTVIRWNGSTWSKVNHGLTTKNLNAVGGNSTLVRIGGDDGVLLKHEGSAWSMETVEGSPDIYYASAGRLRGSDSAGQHSVGYTQSTNGVTGEQRWVNVYNDPGPPLRDSVSTGLTGLSVTTSWTIGSLSEGSNCSSGIVLRETSRSPFSLYAVAGLSGCPMGVFMLSPTQVAVSWWNTVNGVRQFGVKGYDGTTWQSISVPSYKDTYAAAADGTIFGITATQASTTTGGVERVLDVSGAQLRDVWGASQCSGFAVGASGKIYRY